jgi:hypothetical protein
MEGQIDVAVTQLREILKSVPKPDKLNDHPWVECLFVRHHVKGNRLLEKRRPGYQLAFALATIFIELQPNRPPESQKEKSRLNARWARFATLGAYFAPLLIQGSGAAPVTVTDIGARINETIVELVTGKAFDEADEATRTKYRLIYVPEHVSDAPVSRSTLNDWLQQGLMELAGRVLQREEELSLKHDQASPLLNVFEKGPDSVSDEPQPQTLVPSPSSATNEDTRQNAEKLTTFSSTEQQPLILELALPSPATAGNQPSFQEAIGLPPMPLDSFVVVDWWVKERFRETEPASGGAGMVDKARRLAEFLAAIQLHIESSVEPTPSLVRQNVHRAMRGIGIEPDRDNTGDLLIEILERAHILHAVDNRLEFSDPNLVDYFGATHIIEYGQHWVSLQPRHRRLMRWAAACLARRDDNQRTQQFVADLRQALSRASELSWLEVADIVAEFSRSQAPAIASLRMELFETLQRLTPIKSIRLHGALEECGQRLGLDFGRAPFDAPVEAIIPESELERAAAEMELATLLHVIGLTPPPGPDSKLLGDGEVVRALLEQLQKPGDGFQLPCAAWLRRSSLQAKLTFNIDLKAIWKSGAVSALEAVADIAIDSRVDELTWALARSVLTKDDFILRLWVSDEVYRPLVYTLLLALDKRLFFRSDTREWQVGE